MSTQIFQPPTSPAQRNGESQMLMNGYKIENSSKNRYSAKICEQLNDSR